MSQDLIAPGRLRVGINQQSPGLSADVLAAKNDADGRLVVQVNSFGTSANGPYIGIGHARGTALAPTNNILDDNLGDFEYYAYAGGWRQAAEMLAFISGAVADGVTPDTRLEWRVTTGGGLLTRATLGSYGRLALGSGSRASVADVDANGLGLLWVADNSTSSLIVAQHSAGNATPPAYIGRKSRGGSMSAPTTVADGDGLIIVRGGAYTGTWFDDGAFLRFAVDNTVVANQRPAQRFEVYTNLNNSSPVLALRIVSGGSVFIGPNASDTTRRLHVVDATSGVSIVRFQSTGGGASNHVLRLDGGDNATTGSKFSVFHRPDGTEIGSISQNAAGTVIYNITSDVRLKTDIEDSPFGLAEVLQIKPRQFRYRSDVSGRLMQGFIAQELFPVFPDAVSVGANAKDCDCDMQKNKEHDPDCFNSNPWGVDYGRLTPLIVKAVQELAARVAALEGT